MRKEKLIIFTNIPAPYRVAMFNELVRVFQREEKQLNFKVLFMSRSEPNRTWRVDTTELLFPFSVGKGLVFSARRYFFYCNPLLLIECLKPGRHLLLGASWNNTNVMFLILLKRLGLLSNRISLWSEANYMTNGARNSSALKTALRRWVFNTVDGFYVVPGRMGSITLEKWGVKARPYIYLPNLVDEKYFGSTQSKIIHQNNLLRVLIVARLEEGDKGILNFMKSVGHSLLLQIQLVILGSGRSERIYRDFIQSEELEHHVYLMGNQSIAIVEGEYDKADIFVLPSFSDPSPLAVVEALKKGLPLFLSNRCGNHFEAVREGENGYIFDPTNHKEINEKFTLMLEDRNRLAAFSKRSLELADENFNTERVLKNVFLGLSGSEINTRPL
jgi:glycosyltransferase involved in cell wall biosynthesis